MILYFVTLNCDYVVLLTNQISVVLHHITMVMLL